MLGGLLKILVGHSALIMLTPMMNMIQLENLTPGRTNFSVDFNSLQDNIVDQVVFWSKAGLLKAGLLNSISYSLVYPSTF